MLPLVGASALVHSTPFNADQAVLRYAAASETRCKQYILLTSQRSGSTWTCQVLDAQLGVTCGRAPRGEEHPVATEKLSELMINFSPALLALRGLTHREVSWESWVASLEEAFSSLREEGCAGSDRTTAGFKLMYNQVPHHLVPQFLGFLETHEVTVLHLVREASVLRLASNEQSSGLMHSSDANDVASHETAPWQWDNSTAENIRALERLDDAWANVLRLNPKIRYHYVAYEQLISPQRDVYFTELAHITGAPRPSFADVPGELIPLHEPTCEERVAQYSELEHQILGTRTHRACLMLAARPLRVLPDEFGQASPFWGVGPGCGGRPCRW